MARIKGGMNAKRKHKKILKLAKGYRGARSKQYRVAKQSVMRAMAESYIGRKQRKRDFRKLWIARLNAAARMNGLSYSKLMHGLKLAGVELNRKVLSEMAINQFDAFCDVCDVAKGKLGMEITAHPEAPVRNEAPAKEEKAEKAEKTEKKAEKKPVKKAAKKAEEPAEEVKEKAEESAEEAKEKAEEAAEEAEEKAEEAAEEAEEKAEEAAEEAEEKAEEAAEKAEKKSEED